MVVVAGKQQTLRIRSLDHLCKRLRTTKSELDHLCANIDSKCKRYRVTDNGKTREFVEARGRLYVVHGSIHAMLATIPMPEVIHGGVRGRSYKTNAAPHHQCASLLKSDIKDFYPSIRSGRVYDLFRHDLQCSPSVARILTRLTTLDGSLPQGFSTSPLIAVLLTRPLAARIDRMASQYNAQVTFYVDDITISGPNVEPLEHRVVEIIQQERFRAHPGKTGVETSQNKVVTGVRVGNGADVPRDAIKGIREEIQAIALDAAEGKEIDASRIRSIRGRLRYAELNRGAAKHYRRRLRKALESGRRPTEHAANAVE